MATKKNPKTCSIPKCRRERAKDRTICNHHHHEKVKAADPVKYCYNYWRRNAKRRGKAFEISLEFFRKWCYATNYIQKKGRSGPAYTIDRIDPDKGYTEDNIQILSHYDNTSKGNRKLVYDHQSGYAAVVKTPANGLHEEPGIYPF